MTELPTLAQIEAATHTIYAAFGATPQYCWPMLSHRLGTACWVKHENHTPVGAFKVRGGLTYFEHLARSGQMPQEVISATRGNHGQSIAYAAALHGVACTIVVPLGNSVEKNNAMRGFGGEVVEFGLGIGFLVQGHMHLPGPCAYATYGVSLHHEGCGLEHAGFRQTCDADGPSGNWIFHESGH